MAKRNRAQEFFEGRLVLAGVLLCLSAFLGASLTNVRLVNAQSRSETAEAGAMAKAPADIKPGSITYEDVPYPYPVMYMPLTMYGQDVRMAYMDVPPLGQPNGRTVVLLHGMNFGGFYFAGPIDFPRLAKHIADTIPNAELVVIPDVGHVPHIQAPDVFNRDLLTFLESDDTSKAGNSGNHSSLPVH